MQPVQPRWTHAVLVCCNEREEGRPFCGQAGGEALVGWLRDRAREEGIKKRLVIHRTGCLSSCAAAGNTVAIIGPEGRSVFKVREEDREALWKAVRAAVDGPVSS